MRPPCPSQTFGSPITRDVVVGARLYSVSDEGVIVSDVATFQPTAWFAFTGS